MPPSRPPYEQEVPEFSPLQLQQRGNGQVPVRDKVWRKQPMHLSLVGANGSGKTFLVKHVYMLSTMHDVWEDGAVFWVCPEYSCMGLKPRSADGPVMDTVDQSCVFIKEKNPDLTETSRSFARTSWQPPPSTRKNAACRLWWSSMTCYPRFTQVLLEMPLLECSS